MKIPAEKKLSVPYLDQTKAAPTGCESVSSVMLLNYLGIPMSIREFIDTYLDKGYFRTETGEVLPCSVFEKPCTQEGLLEDGSRLIGPDPFVEFAGDPYDPDAMGCYEPVIRKALNRVFEEKAPQYLAMSESGGNLSELAEFYIGRENMPLLVWCTIDQDEAIIGPRWYLEDGSRVTWHSREHCVLLTGYDAAHYIIHDPWNNNGIVSVERELFERGYRQQFLQAAGIRKADKKL